MTSAADRNDVGKCRHGTADGVVNLINKAEIVEAASVPLPWERNRETFSCDSEIVSGKTSLKRYVFLSKPYFVIKVDYFRAGKLNTWCGSPSYAAPEIFEGREYIGPEVDIWVRYIIIQLII